jgi:hypothetical protein
MQRDIVWEWVQRPGLEHLRLMIGDDVIAAEGVIVGTLDDKLFWLRHQILCDGKWRFREAKLALEAAGARRELTLMRDEAGWRADGEARADLALCDEIDLMGSPYTNTLPIRRLELAANEARRIRVAYIRLPDLVVEPVEQEYTRLDASEPPRRFRYRGITSDFTADLTVDADGIVTDYPPVWRRRAG